MIANLALRLIRTSEPFRSTVKSAILGDSDPKSWIDLNFGAYDEIRMLCRMQFSLTAEAREFKFLKVT